MRRSAICMGMLGLIVAGGVPSTTIAQQAAPEVDRMKDLDEETAVAVASLLSMVESLSVDEAIRRIQIEVALAPEIQDIRREFAGRLTEISIEQSPDFHVSVKLKGSGPVPQRQWATSAGSARVEFSTGHAFTEEEFSRQLKGIRLQAQKSIPGFIGLTGYAGDNAADVRIRGGAQDAQKYQGILLKLQRAFGVKLRFKTLEVPETNAIYAIGGAVLQANNSYCTTGFTVKQTSTGAKGIITAGHCPDDLIYGNYGSREDGTLVTFPLIFKEQKNDAQADVQWHQVPSPHTPLLEAYASSTVSTRFIRAVYDAPAVRGTICFRGARSGYSCGLVTSVKHTPGNICGPTESLPCDEVWFKVEGSELACGGGDSGAAMFSGNIGYGIVKSSHSATPLPGECITLTGMPFSRVRAWGFQPN
ncbi:hypothetical protein C1933_09985 [Stenotrophomonas sp. ZAC14D2_NAIMI4_6]|nr:hypothetical protein C1933_09985 [Stenotrophomonas sp. ZAC14D2_NAIMI4_6]